MRKSLQPVIYNGEYSTVMANDLIKGKQSMTLQEARILRLVITQVAKEDKDLKTYTCNIQDLASFLHIPDGNLYRDIKQICESLAGRVVRVGTGNPKNPWKVFPWLQFAEYDGAGNITLMLSEKIKPYVLDLDKYFTQYQLENILEMSSFYAIRLYELIKCDDYKNDDYREYTIEFLRQYFGCEKKYSVFKDFRCRVIESAINEVNKKSDIEISSVEYSRRNRKIALIKFAVHNKSSSRRLREQTAAKKRKTAAG